VLVVDDSRVVRAVVGHQLRAAGYRVEEADNGVAALRRLQSEPFDVVVTDLRMPGLDGLGLLEAAKRRPEPPEVIVLTGTCSQDVDSAIRALRLGAHDYLSKPLPHPDAVVLAIERAVQKKRLADSNRQLIAELSALTRTDALTGALNRRAFDEDVAREAAMARRYGFPISLVLLDLDHFKRINDTEGHQAGDEVLRHFAGLSREATRETDVVYRYGGEEFALLLSHTPLEGALATARRVVALTAASPARPGARALRFTCSAGVASASGAEVTETDLLARADGALYRAKNEGRNRTCTPTAERPAAPPRCAA
jgi:diguanylate cyclase (GGDEF)-like protein